MGNIKFKNNAVSSLDSGISDSATTLDVASGEGDLFPAVSSPNYFYCTLTDSSGNIEIIKVTERTAATDTFTTIVRGQEGTSERAWLADDVVSLRLTAGVIEDLVDDITTLQSDVTALQGALEAPSSLKMYFYEDSAPTGWTYDSGVADKLLSVKGGTNAYDAAGQTTAGTWTPTGHTHTGPSHTHSGPLHTHTIPNHKHNLATFSQTLGSSGVYAYLNGSGIYVAYAGGTPASRDAIRGYTKTDGGGGSTGSGGTGATGSGGTGATGSSAEAATYRPAAAIGIIATKD